MSCDMRPWLMSLRFEAVVIRLWCKTAALRKGYKALMMRLCIYVRIMRL